MSDVLLVFFSMALGFICALSLAGGVVCRKIAPLRDQIAAVTAERDALLEMLKQIEVLETWECGKDYHNSNAKGWRKGKRSKRYIGGLFAADFPIGHRLAIATIHPVNMKKHREAIDAAKEVQGE